MMTAHSSWQHLPGGDRSERVSQVLERAAEAAESTGRDKEFSSQAKAIAKFAIQASPTSKYLITECGETLRTGAFFIYNDISNKPTATPQVNIWVVMVGGGGGRSEDLNIKQEVTFSNSRREGMAASCTNHVGIWRPSAWVVVHATRHHGQGGQTTEHHLLLLQDHHVNHMLVLTPALRQCKFPTQNC